MSFIASNLKYLRKKNGFTQQQFADNLGVKRASVGAYEEERAEPKYDLLNKIAEFYKLSMDDLVNQQLHDDWKPASKAQGAQVRVLSVTVDAHDQENIELVPVKASAGYLNGYGDPEYISELPRFHLPMFKNGTFRAFEIVGDSMLPLASGSVIVAEYIEDWTQVRVGQTYVIVSKSEGVVYKRIGQKYKDQRGLQLLSDNPIYEPYWIESDDIVEVWRAKGFISMELPEPSPEPTIESLTMMISHMQKSIQSLAKS